MKNHIFRDTTFPLSLVLLALSMIVGDIVFAQNSETLEEVTVTGSRIARRDYTSQSPIVTIQSQTFEDRANIGLEAALNQMPQFNVAGTSANVSPASTPFPQADSAPGAATVDLRGLGLNRSLVLIDGRRVQPVNGQLVVDLNTIPSAAIANIEVITGGAAAVYGADAIAGVVNVKLKRDFEGLELSGQYGLSEVGDGEETTVSGLFGANFAGGRGNIMLGANYSKRNQILAKDREFNRKGWEDPGTTGGALGSGNISEFAASFPGPFGPGNPPTVGFIPINGAVNYGIDQNGNVFDPLDPLNPAHPYTGPLGGDSGYKINPDGSLGFDDHERAYVQFPLERYSIFGSAHFAVTEHINVFSDLRFSQTFTSAKGFTSSLFNVWSPSVPYNPVSDDPASPTFGIHPVVPLPFPPGATTQLPLHPVPPQLGAILSSRVDPTAPWTYVGGLDYLGNFDTATTSNVYQILGGFNGDIPGREDWTWEVYATHGKAYVNAFQPEGFPYLPRVQNLFNADQYGTNFDISSLPNYTPVGVTGHCTSGLPIFNPDGSVNNTPSVSQDCSDYLVLRMNDISDLEQDVVEGNLQGGLFNLPAGQLKFAIGADYRRDHFVYHPDSGYNANQDYPNVVQNIILPTSVDGITNVTEAYAELAIPVVKDLPFIKSFEVDPGVRWSDYNTVGTELTYKLLGDLQVNDWIRLRGGWQVANRAPNVNELFTPKGGSQLQGIGVPAYDPCTFYAASPDSTPDYGNSPNNPNRLNVQTLCQYLITRDGGPASLYVPGGNADNYNFSVFGPGLFPFPFSIAVTEGNPNLDSESADTFTAGVVFNSPFDQPALQQATLTLDWYLIEIAGAIAIPDHNGVYQQCLDARFNSLVGSAPGSVSGAEMAANNPFCALIQREYVGDGVNDFGADRKFKAQYLNSGGINTEGFDIQLDWGFDFADMGVEAIPGSFHMNILANYLKLYEEAAFPGADFIDFTGTTHRSSYFDYRTFSTFNYTTGPWSVGLRWQHLPSLDPEPGSAPGVKGVKAHDQVDLFARWSINETYMLRAGIDNLLDAQPEIVGATSTNNAMGATNANYDQIGRRFFFGVTASF